uniref:Secreted protein n=1 Tax=Panagrolaimus davidi TaxID=227884 RepID=A0A914PY83_9BILA
MKLLSVVCLFLVVEFSQQIPFKKSDRKILPLPTNYRKGLKDAGKETALNRERKHFDFGPGSTFISSPVKQKGPRINQKISLDAKNLNDKSILLTDNELIDLFVGEATADVIDPEKNISDSGDRSQRQKRGWIKKILKSAEKRGKEAIPAAAAAVAVSTVG